MTRPGEWSAAGGCEDNDAQFPDESPVQVRYPARVDEDGRWQRTYGLDRDQWPWLPGTVLSRCWTPDGTGEWQVRVDVEDLAEEDEDTGELWFPACFRDASELARADDEHSAGDSDEDGAW